MRRLKRQGAFQPKRTVHLMFLPDEEIGGYDGMKAFTSTDAFRKMNVGFALDEGLASPTDVVPVYFGERALWWIRVRSTGTTGHASGFLEDGGAVQKLSRCINKAFAFRQGHADAFLKDGATLGGVSLVHVGCVNHRVVERDSCGRRCHRERNGAQVWAHHRWREVVRVERDP